MTAGMTLAGCLGVCLAQFGGFGYTIFFYSSWEVMEPLTFLVASWWLMVGLGYYNVRGDDFEYTSVYHSIYKRKFDKLMAQEKLNPEDIEFLEEYIQNLSRELAVVDRRQE
jgi:hypothetical protein